MAAATAPREDTRSRILEVAMELFAEKGFAATSTRELSERLGFTKAALYYHFRTKDDLLLALVEPVLNDLELLATAPQESRADTATRRNLLAGYVELVAAHEQLIRVLSQDPSSARSPALVGVATGIYERLMMRLAGPGATDTTAVTRVRAALGGIHSALLNQRPGDDPQVVRAASLAAACGALGLPPARNAPVGERPSG
jgi:AcrR family transcriptional regulator